MDDSSAPAPAPAAASGGSGASWRGRAGRFFLAVLAVVVVLAALAAGALWWALRTEGGTAFVLTRVPGLEARGPRGTLLGDFHADALSLQFGKTRVALQAVDWQQLSIARPRAAGSWLRVSMARLHAARIDLVLPPKDPSAPPTAPPQNLRLPIELRIESLAVGELHAAALGAAPLRDLAARVELGAERGALHRIDALSAAWSDLHASGRVQIGSGGEMPLDAEIRLGQPALADRPAWQADARLSGPLVGPRLQASAAVQPGQRGAGEPAQRGQGATGGQAQPGQGGAAGQANPSQIGGAPQALTAEATLRPFADFPVTALLARTEALDLAAFIPGAPATALSGSVQARADAADRPADIDVTLTNAAAGPWDTGRVPLRAAQLTVHARPSDPSQLDVTALSAELGTASAAAGGITGSGHWETQGWTLDVALADLAPARLDGRAPAMRLGGRLKLDGSGFSAGQARHVEVTGNLRGRLESGPPRPVDLQVEGGWDSDPASGSQRVTLRRLRASQGAAPASGRTRARARAATNVNGSASASASASTTVTASGSAARERADVPWHIAGKVAVADLDPVVWWPGPEGSAWRRGGHRLNLDADADLTLPQGDTPADPQAWLAALQGSADLRVSHSRLAGVPVEAAASLRAAAGNAANLTLTLDLAGNGVSAQGWLARVASQPPDHWAGTVAAPALQRLSALWDLFSRGADRTAAGSLQGRFQLDGRWPRLSTEGELHASGVQAAGATARNADARWRLGTAASAALQLDLRAEGLRAPAAFNAPGIASLTLRTTGSAEAHRIDLRTEVEARPPAWTDALQPGTAAAKERTVAEVHARGGLLRPAASAGPADLVGWQGTLEQVSLRTTGPNAVPLLRTGDLGIEARWAGGPPRVVVQPGRAEAVGAVLRWARIAWQGADGGAAAARLDADATLEPMAIAPILTRLQPGFGWGGDLRIGAHLSVHSAPTFRADVVVERAGGDLTVTTGTQTRPLGLTDLRLGLAADQGVWNFTLALAGRVLGVASGAVVVRTAPSAPWPPADAPVQGNLEVQIADLNAFSAWVPVGWRIAGALHASATVGGRFGAPEYSGRLQGSGLGAGNFLQGIQVTDGELDVVLQGTTARIQKFVARAGAGTLRMEGGAELGAAPSVRLTLQADRFQALGRVDRRIVVSGRAQARIDKSTLALDGRLTVDEGLIDLSASSAPHLSDDVIVIRDERDLAPRPPPAAAPGGREVALDLWIDLGNNIKVTGLGIDTGLAGTLHVTAPQGSLAVNGEVRAVNGRYTAYGQNLKIEHGVIGFNGALENPRLDIQATRPDLDEVKVGVAITGTALNPRVRLFSTPEMTDLDKLSWLTMGRASSSLAGNQTAVVQHAAMALLAGNKSGGNENGIAKALGLTDISVSGGESGGLADAVVSVGKQISQRWYVGYSQTLQATGGSLELIYNIAERFKLRVQTGVESSQTGAAVSALDLIFTWRWD